MINYNWNNITTDITLSIYQSQYFMSTIINNIIIELFKIDLELQPSFNNSMFELEKLLD